MPQFLVKGFVTTSFEYEIKAEDEEEARDLAVTRALDLTPDAESVDIDDVVLDE